MIHDCLKQDIKAGDIVAWLVSDTEDNFDGAAVACGIIKEICDQGPMFGVWVHVAGVLESGEECNVSLRPDEVLNMFGVYTVYDATPILKKHAARCHYAQRYEDDAAEWSAWVD